jgi:hypothetical protein
MPASTNQVMNGIKTRLATISGLRAYASQPPQVNPPLAFPIINSISYHKAMAGGLVLYDLAIILIVGRYDDNRAHDLLDDFISYSGAKSIRAAIEGDQTLVGVAQNAIVSQTYNITALNVADADFLQVSTSVQVSG